jgi:hypothetical protein
MVHLRSGDEKTAYRYGGKLRVDKWWSSSHGVGWGAKKPSLQDGVLLWIL